MNATFTDPGVLDAHTATIDFDDGLGPQPATVDEVSRSGTVTGLHQYFVPKTYIVDVCVTDKDGDPGCDDLNLVVEALP